MAEERFDVVIIGGAAMGSSVACHLLADRAFGGRVLVLDLDMTYVRAASALSAASIRQQFTTRVNIQVSIFGLGFLRRLGEQLGLPGQPPPEAGLKEGGYLYLAGSDEAAARLSENWAQQVAEGADILHLDKRDLARRFGFLALDGVFAGNWGRSGEGWFDGWSLLQGLRAKARALGAVYREAEVVGLAKNGNRVTAVRLADGTWIGCDVVVNCAGAAGGRQVAAMAGIDIPVYAKKRCVFTFQAKTRPEPFPLLIDTSGVWCRPEGDGFVAGISPDDGTPDDAVRDYEVVWREWEEMVWPAVAARVPAFEAVKPGRAWACYYDMNLFDHNAIVGPAPQATNFHLCNGYSGHGLQQAPAIGRGIAELITHGRFITLDLSDFSFARLGENRPLLEKNVI
jgi:glycine/D-amino acid oxidase-like deaminating enzyme